MLVIAVNFAWSKPKQLGHATSQKEVFILYPLILSEYTVSRTADFGAEQHIAHMRQHTLRLLDLGLAGFSLLAKEVEARLELAHLLVYPLPPFHNKPIDLPRIRAYADCDRFLETTASLVHNHNAHAARAVPLLPDEHRKNR